MRNRYERVMIVTHKDRPIWIRRATKHNLYTAGQEKDDGFRAVSGWISVWQMRERPLLFKLTRGETL